MSALPWAVDHKQRLSGVRAKRQSFIESQTAEHIEAVKQFVTQTVNDERRLIFHSQIPLKLGDVVEIGPQGETFPFRVIAECTAEEYRANYGQDPPPGYYYYEFFTD